MRARRCRRAGVLLALALVGTVASACSPYSGTTTQKVQQWASNSAFIADSNTLLSDISRVRRAVSIGTPKELRTICAGLAYDVGTTYETLPTPDLRLTNAMNAADETLFRASNTCADSSSVTSPATRQAVVQLGGVEPELKRVQSLLETFGVRWRARL